MINHHHYFPRLPKFKSEVKRILRLAMPVCLVEQVPGMGDNTITGYSSYKHQSTPGQQRKSFNMDKNEELKPGLRRLQSVPERGSGSEGRDESLTPRRAESTRVYSNVRFSSMGSYPSTSPNVTPDR